MTVETLEEGLKIREHLIKLCSLKLAILTESQIAQFSYRDIQYKGASIESDRIEALIPTYKMITNVAHQLLMNALEAEIKLCNDKLDAL